MGVNRAIDLVSIIGTLTTGKPPTKVIEELKATTNWGVFGTKCEEFGVFTGIHTLEVDLFQEDDDYMAAVIETLREGPFGSERQGWIDEWEANPAELDIEKFLPLIENMDKGRFAQRLAGHIAVLDPPAYIADAMNFRPAGRGNWYSWRAQFAPSFNKSADQMHGL